MNISHLLTIFIVIQIGNCYKDSFLTKEEYIIHILNNEVNNLSHWCKENPSHCPNRYHILNKYFQYIKDYNIDINKKDIFTHQIAIHKLMEFREFDLISKFYNQTELYGMFIITNNTNHIQQILYRYKNLVLNNYGSFTKLLYNFVNNFTNNKTTISDDDLYHIIYNDINNHINIDSKILEDNIKLCIYFYNKIHVTDNIYGIINNIMNYIYGN